jgi:hypothetical protein
MRSISCVPARNKLGDCLNPWRRTSSILSGHGLRDIVMAHLKEAQTHVMKQIWGNMEDEVWNEL